MFKIIYVSRTVGIIQAICKVGFCVSALCALQMRLL